MNYEEFKSNLLCELRGYFPEDVSFMEQKVVKNNGVELDAVAIREKGSFVSPNIYINGYYEEYMSDHLTIGDIACKIHEIYLSGAELKDIDIDDFLDFEKARQNIVFKLVNYEKNRERLKDMPYIRYLDLAIVFYYIFPEDKNELASVQITNSHIARWGTTIDEINEIAMRNTPSILQAEIKNIFDIMRSRMNMADLDECREDAENFPMYVITNSKGVNGAACLLYPGLLTNFSARFDCDMYIVPSSVHEIIMIPAEKISDCEKYDEMIRFVNETQLAETEVLSDHVYFYTREKCAVGY